MPANTSGSIGTCDERELLNRIALNVELRVCDEIKRYKTVSDINYDTIIALIFDTMQSKKDCVKDLFTGANIEQTISKLIFLTLLGYFSLQKNDDAATFIRNMEIAKIESSIHAYFNIVSSTSDNKSSGAA